MFQKEKSDRPVGEHWEVQNKKINLKTEEKEHLVQHITKNNI